MVDACWRAPGPVDMAAVGERTQSSIDYVCTLCLDESGHTSPRKALMSPSARVLTYRQARDELLARRDPGQAAAEFVWPTLDSTFNWAIDWFDVIARGNDRPALRIVEEDGADRSYTFDEMARRSDQVATWLESRGVGPDDRVMIMLGNQIELWESILAVMKLGAVIMPATPALGPKDLADRIARGGAGHVITNADQADKFVDIVGGYGRFAVGAAGTGWAA